MKKKNSPSLSIFASEIDYWDKELSFRGYYPNAIKNRSNPQLMYKEYPGLLEKYRAKLGENLKVLDVGSGPLSMLAYGHQEKIYTLQCVDPLGDIYKELLKKYKFKISYEIITCAGEKLSTKLKTNYYDIVWIHNALDHSQSPSDVMKEMVKVLKPGGYLCIAGWAKEGEAEGYNGLHQNDLYLRNGNLMLCKREQTPERIDDLDNLQISEYLVEYKPREWFHIVYQKIEK